MSLSPVFPSALHPFESSQNATVALAALPFFTNSISTPAITPPPLSNLSRSSLSASQAVAERIGMPQPGDAFFGFRIVEELGHGTFARVFLAKQEALAGREVALKVTLRPTREPERIARLQHTNVVPVYSVHEATPVQIICMPYLGRRTLADALVGYRKSQVAAPGHSTLKALATKRGSSVAGTRSRSGFRLPASSGTHLAPPTPIGATPLSLVGNCDAVLRIVSQLASGLAHAHERGVLHLDLKPANVLLADTGEPMLLDFNLSFAAFEASREVVGGTVPYMAPEQLLDLKTRGEGQVDARTDLYSLGVMTFELLTGKHPFPVTSRTLTEFDGLIADRLKGPPSLREIDPDIAPAVESIVNKLLAPKPEDRYQNAGDLHEDLERQLTDRPLQFAADRSIPERFGKWRRRNPKVLVAVLIAAALVAAGGTSAYAFSESEKRVVGEAETQARNFHDGIKLVQLDLTLSVDPKARTRGMNQAMILLAEYGLPADPNWQSKLAFQKLTADHRSKLSGEVGELLLLLAHARLQEGKAADPAGAANDARMLNELAKGCFGEKPPPMLIQQRAQLEGTPVEAGEVGKSASARDHFLDGVLLIGEGKFDAAIPVLERAISDQPDHATSQFLLAYSRDQLGQYDRALERYQSAAVLMPTDPRPDYYSGVALGLMGQAEAAEKAFSKALEFDPKYGDAYRNRGIARMEQGEYRDAEKDLTSALENDASPFQTRMLRVRAREQLENEEGAEADRKALASMKPDIEADYIARGYTLMLKEPKEAVGDFQAALEQNPRSLLALRNLVVIHMDLAQSDRAALETTTRLVELYPEYAPGHADKALCLARLGQRDAAHREAEVCRKLLAKKAQQAPDATSFYRLACTYSVTSRTESKDAAMAIQLLKAAWRSGFRNIAALESNLDLAPIRELPEFAPILKAMKEIS